MMKQEIWRKWDGFEEVGGLQTIIRWISWAIINTGGISGLFLLWISGFKSILRFETQK